MLVVVRWNSTFHFNNTHVKTDFFKTWNKIGSIRSTKSHYRHRGEGGAGGALAPPTFLAD